MASAFGKKKKPKQLNTRQIAFGGGTIWVPIDELPIISYWKFLFSSVYKLCQNLTVLAEITHARCLPQADFFWIASSKKCLSYFQEQNYGKILCFVHAKNISATLLKSSCTFMLAIWHRVIFLSGCYIHKHKKCPYYIKLSLKNHCMHTLGKDIFCSYIFLILLCWACSFFKSLPTR